MRGLHFATATTYLAGSLFIGSLAFAQTTTVEEPTPPAEESSSSASTTSNTTSSSTTTVTSPPPIATPATTGTGQSTASALEVAPKKERRLKLELYNEHSISQESLLNSDGAPVASNYVGPMYKLTPTRSISYRQVFTYQYGTSSTDGKFKMGDGYVNYMDAKMINFSDPTLNLTGIFRYYVPTGEKTRFLTKSPGNIVAWGIGTKTVGKVDFNIHLQTRFWIQSQNYYQTTETNDAGVAETTTTPNYDYNIIPWVDVVYNFSKNASFTLSAGTDNLWYRPVPGQPLKREHFFTLTPSLTYTPVKGFNIIAVVENYVNIYDPADGRAFKVFRPDETKGYLILAAAI